MDMDSSTTERAEEGFSTFKEWQWPRFPSGSTYIPIRPTPPRTEIRNAPEPCPPLLLLDNSDTLVFIDSPPRSSTNSILPASRGYVPHRIHSRKLLQTNSPFFKKLFNPRTQARIVKRRGLTDGLTNGLKYAIDLTPPTEGEDAVITITELSCPLGIRTWSRCQKRWCLPISCVGGQEEVEALDTNTHKGFGGLLSQEGYVGTPEAEREKLVLPLEYSPSRHYAGIEQILQALEDFHPQLDTPCKLWTFFALAKLYDIATAPKICDLILSWFYESTNVRFLEIHPEISYRIACGIQCASLCRDTFSILVGEEALLLLANGDEAAHLGRPRVTWHGRLRESLDDTELQRIEYASKSFLDHVTNRFVHLMGASMAWLHDLSEFQKVHHCQPRSSQEEKAKSQLLAALKDFVRSTLLSPLTGRVFERGDRKASLSSHDHEGYPPPNFANAYKEMSPTERIISRTFWHSLSIESFSGQCPFRSAKPFVIAFLAKSIPQFAEQEDWRSSGISRKELIARVVDFNSFYRRFVRRVFNWDASRPQMTANAPRFESSVYSAPQLQNLPGIDLVLPLEAIEFDLESFFAQAQRYVNDYAKQMITPRSSTMFYELTDTLTCLTENEFKYLPLWAGGNDDGSGGVFTDDNVPLLETGGFSTPGPAIHTGSTASSVMSHSTIAPTEFESTVQGASHRATESHESDLMSIDTDIGHQDSERNSDHVPFSWQSADDDTSIDLSSADDEEFDFDSASDSTGTVVMGSPSHSDLLSDFEEVHVDDNNASSSRP
ncbi:hypothetical protein IFM53868_00423 [Aspergillus udagawae]|uniref:BTB domain-containing protein n=1 Tax=Aspergillus udagawae TaxID=91492 RepID=A0ABQ1A0X0_9EURO|nr:hypothetical protein IFM53868_00423 [Aspergillus udagawae]